MSNNTLALLGLGSNMGDRLQNLRFGLRSLCRGDRIRLAAVSAIYESEPVDCEGGLFLNAVVRTVTSLKAHELLAAAKEVERMAGRTGTKRQARPLDIDLLFLGDLVVSTPDIVLPHPAIFERPFVFLPLLEVCEDMKNPKTGRLIRAEAASALAKADKLPRRVDLVDWWK